MATELTPQFRQAEAELVEAETAEARLAAIQKMRTELAQIEKDEAAELTDLKPKINSVAQLGWETFQRDLPELVKERRGWWVAYHGDRRLALAADDRELYQRFWSEGVPEDELVVEYIEPRPKEYWFL